MNTVAQKLKLFKLYKPVCIDQQYIPWLIVLLTLDQFLDILNKKFKNIVVASDININSLKDNNTVKYFRNIISQHGIYYKVDFICTCHTLLSYPSSHTLLAHHHQ